MKLTFKDKFMELLDDEDVIKKLNRVLKQKNKTPDNSEVMSAEYKRLENENISLKSQLDKITEENDGLENTISEKQRDITNLRNYNHDILEKYHSNQKELDELKSELAETKAELKKSKNAYISLSSQFERIQTENDGLKNTISEKQSDISDWQKRYNAKEQELNETKSKLAETKADSDTLKGYFRKPFELYDRYKNLDDRIKRQISNIISDKSIMAFISSCSQYGNLEMLWDHTKYLLLNGEDISILRDIFGYFFELLNESAEKPPYAWSEDNTGIRYDDSRHICGYNSSAQGIVREIQLRGYVSANTGKIVRKTVVKAER